MIISLQGGVHVDASLKSTAGQADHPWCWWQNLCGLILQDGGLYGGLLQNGWDLVITDAHATLSLKSFMAWQGALFCQGETLASGSAVAMRGGLLCLKQCLGFMGQTKSTRFGSRVCWQNTML